MQVAKCLCEHSAQYSYDSNVTYYGVFLLCTMSNWLIDALSR